MSGHAVTPPGALHLRLVGGDAEASLTHHSNGGSTRADVARENHLSASMDVRDAMAAFAVEIAQSLEGGSAAILRPERRRALVASAVSRGFRPFDAHLAIAVVQDAVRSGQDGCDRGRMRGLGLIPPPQRAGTEGWMLGIAAALGLACLAGLLAWMMGA